MPRIAFQKVSSSALHVFMTTTRYTAKNNDTTSTFCTLITSRFIPKISSTKVIYTKQGFPFTYFGVFCLFVSVLPQNYLC